jgi:hypothetical protein
MNNNAKFAITIAVVIVVSVLTSYVTTVTLNSNNDSDTQQSSISQTTIQPSLQNTSQTSTNKIFPSHSEDYSAENNESVITVTSSIAIRDLTVVYHYTALNGSAYSQEFHYGDYFPSWGPNNIVNPNQVQFQYYRIPQSVVSACSNTKSVFSKSGDYIGQGFDVQPNITVTVYGYS